MPTDTIAIPTCPITRYLTAAADRGLREYADADDLATKEAKLQAAIDLARLVENTILPMARTSGNRELFGAAQAQVNRLLDLARPWIDKHPSQFPKKPDHTLQMLDVLDQLEREVRLVREGVDRLAKRRDSRSQRKEAA